MTVKNLSRTKLREIQDAWDSGALKPQSTDKHKFNRKVWVKNNTGMRLNYGDHVKIDGFSVVKSANIAKRSAMTNGLVFNGTIGNDETPSEMIASVITPAKARKIFQAEIPLEYAFIKNRTVDDTTYYPTVGEYASASNEADETTGVYRILATSLPGVDGENLGKFCAIARIAGTAEEGGVGMIKLSELDGNQFVISDDPDDYANTVNGAFLFDSRDFEVHQGTFRTDGGGTFRGDYIRTKVGSQTVQVVSRVDVTSNATYAVLTFVKENVRV